ncbi:MAG: metallophosphoesterase, partial [Candidatus Eremiobacterota bacterium]
LPPPPWPREKTSFSALAEQSRASVLPDREAVLESLEGATRANLARPGLVELPSGVPTLVVTDIHGRRDYLLQALEVQTPQGRVYDLLQEGRMNLLCLGDGMHSEGRARERWQEADRLAVQGDPAFLDLLDQEMVESLGTMKMVMDLKQAFPANFHYLRGNHDDVKGELAGNYRKYAVMNGESSLVREWMTRRLGEDFVERYAAFEDSMPLVARGEGFLASHAAPSRVVGRQEVEARDRKAALALAWTENSRRDGNGNYLWETEEHRENLRQNMENLGAASGSVWFAGHRVVRDDEHEGRFRSQFEGRLVQLNDPDEFVFAMVPAGGGFDPERDVFRPA